MYVVQGHAHHSFQSLPPKCWMLNMHTVMESLKKCKSSPILHPIPLAHVISQEEPADAGVLGTFQGYSEHRHMLVQPACMDALPPGLGLMTVECVLSRVASVMKRECWMHLGSSVPCLLLVVGNSSKTLNAVLGGPKKHASLSSL